MSELETYTQRIRKEGKEEGKAELITRLVRDRGMSIEAVADLFGFTVDEVRSYVESVSLSA